MQVFRADDDDAMRLFQPLSELGVSAKVERYGSSASYVVASSTRPDLLQVARSIGRSVRQVHTLTDLARLATDDNVVTG